MERFFTGTSGELPADSHELETELMSENRALEPAVEKPLSKRTQPLRLQSCRWDAKAAVGSPDEREARVVVGDTAAGHVREVPREARRDVVAEVGGVRGPCHAKRRVMWEVNFYASRIYASPKSRAFRT